MSGPDIPWRKMNSTNWKAFCGFSLADIGVYPMMVLKTRMQCSTTERDGFSLLKEIAKKDGKWNIGGLYRGYGTTVASRMASTIVYDASIDKTKAICSIILKPFQLKEENHKYLVDGGGAVISTMLTQFVSVPTDIVRKTLMVEGFDKIPKYNNVLEILSTILKNQGAKGLYKGLSLPLAAYCPSTIVWWKLYESSQSLLQDNMLLQAYGGASASIGACLLNAPLDIISSKIQVNHVTTVTTEISAIEIAKNIYHEQGLRGFYKGFTPRCLSFAVLGASSTLLYEYVKKL